MSIRRRLIMLLTIAAATLLILGVTAMLQFQRSNRMLRDLTDTAIPGFLATTELANSLKGLQIASINLLNAPDKTIAEQLRDEVITHQNGLREKLDAQLATTDNDTQKGLVKQAQESLRNYYEALDQVAGLSLAGQKMLAEATLSGNAAPYLKELEQILETLRVEKRRAKDDTLAALEASQQQSVTILAGALAATLIVIILLGLRLYRQISRPLKEMEQTMS